MQTDVIITFCLALCFRAVTLAAAGCQRNKTVIWRDNAEPDDTTQYHAVGKQWRIDCRNNASSDIGLLLLQKASRNSSWQERRPNGVDLTEGQQIFTISSLDESDVGYYYCKVCNETKYVGKLNSDTSRNPITISAIPRQPIRNGDYVQFTCSVQGIYQMSWIMVADNGAKISMESKDDSLWQRGWRYTRRILVIPHFRDKHEQLYMCLITRAHDNYTSEKEVYPFLQRKSIPIHRYFTSLSTTEIGGHMYHVILHVYSCHLPLVVSIAVLQPIKKIHWIRNFTADQTVPLKIGKDSGYGLQMEMHVHPGGFYQNNIHVTADIVSLGSNHKWRVMNRHFLLKKVDDCKREACQRPDANTVKCPRYLDDLNENLNATFMLKLQHSCTKKFTLEIQDRQPSGSELYDSILMKTDFVNKTQARMKLKGFDNQDSSTSINGRVKFNQFFLTLDLQKSSKNIYRVKLLLDMPDIGMRGHFVVMEEDFNIDDSLCSSPSGNGDDQRKIIAIVIIAVFISGLSLFAAVWLYRRYRRSANDGFLLTAMEDEAL